MPGALPPALDPVSVSVVIEQTTGGDGGGGAGTGHQPHQQGDVVLQAGKGPRMSCSRRLTTAGSRGLPWKQRAAMRTVGVRGDEGAATHHADA